MALTLKRDEETQAPAITEDGKIIYLDDNGAELPLDPAAMYQKINDLGKQNKTDRTNYTTLRNKYKLFEGIEDLDTWKTEADSALETVKNFNEKDWLEASKVEALKKDMKDAYDTKLSAKDTAMADLQKAHQMAIQAKDSQIRSLMVSTKFASSSYFNGEKRKTNLNPEIAEAYFGKHFKVEQEGEKTFLRAYDVHGDVINSKLNPGEPADFEEAMGIIINNYPGKDSILIAPGGGSGAPGGGGDMRPADQLALLQKQHTEALAAGQTTLAVGLKNRIFELQRKVSAA